MLKAASDESSISEASGAEPTDEDGEDEADEAGIGSRKLGGYGMPYDTARKLAQGLGADLVKMSRLDGIVTIKRNVAMLNGVAHRESGLTGLQLTLFGDVQRSAVKPTRSRLADGTAAMRDVQGRLDSLFDNEMPLETHLNNPVLPILRPGLDTRSIMDRLLTGGSTMLDRLHQAMLLFARDQTSLVRPFLTETSMGADPRFWRLAQARSALYLASSEEKRWVDGVLARKKGLGF